MISQPISRIVARITAVSIALAVGLLLVFGYAGRMKLEAAALSEASGRVKALIEANVPQVTTDLIAGNEPNLALRLTLLRANSADSRLEVKVWDRNKKSIFETELFGETFPDAEIPTVGETSSASGWVTSVRVLRDGLDTVGYMAFSIGINQSSSAIFRSFMYQSVAILLAALSLMIVLLNRALKRNVVEPISLLVSRLPSFSLLESSNLFLKREHAAGFRELSQLEAELSKSYWHMSEHARIEKQLALELAEEKARVAISRQVAHDIRSPLSALNMVAKSITHASEAERNMLRAATQRINDIANGLLYQTKNINVDNVQDHGPESETALPLEPTMLVALLDTILSEKRMQYREHMEIEIQGDLLQGYGFFARINSREFTRAISNLINNSVEAFVAGGKVTVSITGSRSEVTIVVRDNGKGIGSQVLRRIGERGFSYGKGGGQGGSGLGVFHAKATVERAGGQFSIESKLGSGTSVTIVLPRAETPEWFVEKIELRPTTRLISVDDDQTIHQIWKGRLTSLGLPGDQHLAFSSLEIFEEWLTSSEVEDVIYLVDYEFLGQSANGLDVIEKAGISDSSVLVTSRYDEPWLRDRAAALGVRIVPKGLAPVIPIHVEKNRETYDAILLDDDLLQHMTWTCVAREKGRSLLCFSTPDELFSRIVDIDTSSPLFIDVNLANGVRGEDVALQAAGRGFSEIYLATGYEADSISAPGCVKAVVGKDPVL